MRIIVQLELPPELKRLVERLSEDVEIQMKPAKPTKEE